MSNGIKAAKLMTEETEAAPSGNLASPVQDRERQIAEAAYYRAEKRGFEPGNELEDWCAAEQEIDAANTGC